MSYEVRASQIILRAFDPFLRLTEDEVQCIGQSDEFKIPKIDVSTIIKLCDETIECYIAEEKKRREQDGMSHLLHIPLPAYVIGDLHGNLHDFIRILSKVNSICNSNNEAQDLKKIDSGGSNETRKKTKKKTMLYEKRFLFLGDYVDRGEYSVELIMILFALKIQYPEQFFLIRGNHEFTSVNSQYGFLDELVSTYGGIGTKQRRKSHYEKDIQRNDIDDDHMADSNESEQSSISHSGSNFGDGNMIWRKFNQAFEYIPLAAVLGEKYFCIHGGLSPHLTSLDSLGSIPYPLDEITPGLVSDLLWSDPSSVISEFVTNPRGAGVSYGDRAMKTFLTITGLKKIIRAHEKQMNGIKVKKHIMTIFSTSGYSDSNQGGFCFIKRSRRSINEKGSDSNSDYDRISDSDPNPIIESDSYAGEEENSEQQPPKPRQVKSLHPSLSFRSVHLSADQSFGKRISASYSARGLESGNDLHHRSDSNLILNTFTPPPNGAESDSRICPLQKKKNSVIKCFVYDCRETPKRNDAVFYDYIIPLQKIKYVHSANGGLEIRNNRNDDDDKITIDQCTSSFNSSNEPFNNNSTNSTKNIIRPVVKLHAVKSFLTTSRNSSRPTSSRRSTKNPLHKNQSPS